MVSQTSRATPTCIWVQAGLLSYRLCQRNFDCEHCPLDAALRGKSLPTTDGQAGDGSPGLNAAAFPSDRLYSNCHTWVQRCADEPLRVRLGLDSFLTSCLPTPGAVRWLVKPGLHERATEMCEVDLGDGVLPVLLPLDARLERTNEALAGDPGLLLASPYSDGWIAELSLVAAGQLEDLLEPETASRHARLDARLLRRRIAMQMLLDTEDGAGASGEAGLTDIRGLLGERRFLRLLRELIFPEC